MTKNVCETGKLQSPIDVREKPGTHCHEFHEVRSLKGEFGIFGDRVERLIESNKLRFKYDRRPCRDLTLTRCQEPDPPHADFPNGWPGFADVTHVDFKVPSEHTIWGKRYDAEMQIYHIYESNKRVATQAVVIEAVEGGHNYYFQEALNAFQRQYNENRASCDQRRHVQQQFPTTNHHNETEGDARSLQTVGVWDPHHVMLIPTIWFWRYDGT